MGGVVVNFVLIPLLILSALLLPPISLADRLLSIGYEGIGREGGAVQDPDGTQITFQPLTSPVDLIVSNPPYVSSPELAAAMPEVSRYEPHLALDGGPDGLDVIRRLLGQAREKLNPGGALLVEIGSNQGQAVAQLARTLFPQALIRVEQDLAGLDRLLVVEL